MFSEIDKNGDGVITLDELLDLQTYGFATRHERDVLNGLVKMFNIVDRDHSLTDKRELWRPNEARCERNYFTD